METRSLRSMVVESSEKDLQSENQKTNDNGQLGYSTEEALERLSSDIQDVLESHETKFKKERSVVCSVPAHIFSMDIPLFIVHLFLYLGF